MSEINHTASGEPGNPVIPVYAADPHTELFGNRYYIYATHAGMYSSTKAFEKRDDKEAHGFAAWSSSDLRHWKTEGPILLFSEIDWAKDFGDAWAPCMAERNGRYYFYFCSNSRIGVAVGDSPIGPFADAVGEPLIPFLEDMSSIDPMVFVDDDGQAYFYWGAVPGAWLEHTGIDICTHLSVRVLNPDMVSFAGEEIPTISTQQSPGGWHITDHIEASHVFKRNGIYYLMWSPGGFASNKDEEAYRVHYATSKSPLGPWKLAPNNPVLSTRREVGVVGPGHHSTIQLPGTDEWYCVYHCHKGDADRRTFIDRMTFAPDGTIETIIPTLEGPPVRTLPIDLVLEGKGPYDGTSILLKANVADEIKANVQKVEFFSGPNKIGEATEALQFQWQQAPIGFHRLTARAILTSGQTLTSAWLNTDVI